MDLNALLDQFLKNPSRPQPGAILALKERLLESTALMRRGIWELFERPGSFGLDLSEGDRAELWAFMDRAFPLVEKLERLRRRIEEAEKVA